MLLSANACARSFKPGLITPHAPNHRDQENPMSVNKPHTRQAAAPRKRPNPLLNTSASTAMAVGLATAALVPTVAFAQEQKPTTESRLETVNVVSTTGLPSDGAAAPGCEHPASASATTAIVVNPQRAPAIIAPPLTRDPASSSYRTLVIVRPKNRSRWVGSRTQAWALTS